MRRLLFQLTFLGVIFLAHLKLEGAASMCAVSTPVDKWDECVGEATFKINQSYRGYFRLGKPDGAGVATIPNGYRYIGEFRNGAYEGFGAIVNKNNELLQGGFWEGGKFVRPQSVNLDQLILRVGSSVVIPPPKQNQDRLQDIAPNNERDLVAAQLDSERRRRQALEIQLQESARLAAAQQEEERRKRQALEVKMQESARLAAAQQEEERRKRQELETKIAETQATARPGAQVAHVRNAHALVIGIAAYPGSYVLANPINDANSISQRLRLLGFTVTTVTDLNREQLVQAFAKFQRSAAAADLTLLFYSGHGAQISGENYILPTDIGGAGQITLQGVSMTTVLENFMPGKTRLVFLDACRDNPFQSSSMRSTARGLAPISVSAGTLISYAAKDGQVALDGLPGTFNSPFTQALLEHIGDPTDIAVVLRKVREKVMQATSGKQQPWEYGSLTGGDLILSAIRAAGK